MHRIEVLVVSFLVALSKGTPSSQFPNWQLSWILGGSSAAPEEFPFMVSVRNAANNKHDCGGSIISRWSILTAAHCVLGSKPSSIIVVVGSNKLKGRGQKHTVSEYIPHHAYDASTNNNDIAILTLKEPVVYSSRVQPVTLPKEDLPTAPGTRCTTMGWGYTSRAASSFPNNLQKVRLKIISNNVCRTIYPNIVYAKICATAVSGKGTCQHDSGGPLICNGQQVGILRGAGLPRSVCSAPFPTEFVYVPYYLKWIKMHAL